MLASSDFVFPIDSRRVDEGIEAMLCCWLQQLQEYGGPEVDKVDKPDLLKGSIGSLKNLGLSGISANNNATASTTGSLVNKQNNANMLEFKARYQGDLVQLKEIQVPSGNAIELKTKAMDHLILLHGLRHENINPLIGFLSDPNRTALVFEHCSRGSLQDVLIMDEIKLDWSFRLSLLTDLARGMRYLHTSPLRVHGSLTSRNCVVDARWVLKITDYGLPALHEAQGLAPAEKSAKGDKNKCLNYLISSLSKFSHLQSFYGRHPKRFEEQKTIQNMEHKLPMFSHLALSCRKLLYAANRTACYHYHPKKSSPKSKNPRHSSDRQSLRELRRRKRFG